MNSFENEVDAAVICLKQGGVMVYPTDTIWGVGCDATKPEAVLKVFEAKQRPANKNLIVLVANVQQIYDYVENVPDIVPQLIADAQKPISIIFPKSKNLAQGITTDGSVAIRVVNNDFCKAVIKALGHPITSTSANISGDSAPACFAEISQELKQNVDYVVDLYHDDKSKSEPSSIVKLHDDGSCEIIRP